MANRIDREYERTFGDDGAGAPAWLKKKQLEMYEQGMTPEEIRKSNQERGEKVQEVIDLPEEAEAPKNEPAEVTKAGPAEATQEAPKEQAPEANEAETVATRDEALAQDREAMMAAARAEGYKQAQEEMAMILNGRSIEQALAYYDKEIADLEQGIARMQEAVPDESMRSYYEKVILEAQGDLGSMERKRQMIENLQHGGNAVEAPEPKELSEQAAGGELGDLNPREEIDIENLESEVEKLPEEKVEPGKSEVTGSEETEIVVPEPIYKVIEVEFPRFDGGEPEVAQIRVVMNADKMREAEAWQAEQKLQEEERQRLERECYEKGRKRGGFKKFVHGVKAAVAALIVTATVGMGWFNLNVHANSMALENAEPMPSRATQSMNMSSQNEVGDEDEAEGEHLADWERAYRAARQEQRQAAEEFMNESGVQVKDFGDVEKLANYDVLENGTFYNYDEYYGYGDINAKVTPNSFGMDKSYLFENKDVNETANTIYKIAHDQPEVLASYVAHFPSILAKCGLPANITSNEIDEMLSKGENGGELQKNLLAGLKEMLEDENTQYEFVLAQGRVRTPYMIRSDDTTPAGHTLAMDEETRLDAPQVWLTKMVQNADGSKSTEVIHINLECQQDDVEVPEPDLPPEEPIIVTNVEVMPDPDPEPIPVPEPEPEPEPDPEPDPDPEPEPDPEPDPDPEPEPDETPKPKDPDSLIDNGSLGLGEDNNIDQTPNIDNMTPEQIEQVGDGEIDRGDITGDQTGTYEVTEEPTIAGDNQDTKVDNAVPDANLSGDEQNQVQQAVDEAETAADAMEEEGARPSTEDEIDAYLQQLLNNPMDNNGEMDG